MRFGEAVEAIRGKSVKVQRAGWNGKGMWLSHVWGASATVGNSSVAIEPFIVLKTADGKFLPWNSSQADVLAEDWSIVE